MKNIFILVTFLKYLVKIAIWGALDRDRSGWIREFRKEEDVEVSDLGTIKRQFVVLEDNCKNDRDDQIRIRRTTRSDYFRQNCNLRIE